MKMSDTKIACLGIGLAMSIPAGLAIHDKVSQIKTNSKNTELVQKYRPANAEKIAKIYPEDGKWEIMEKQAKEIKDSLKMVSKANSAYFLGGNAAKDTLNVIKKVK